MNKYNAKVGPCFVRLDMQEIASTRTPGGVNGSGPTSLELLAMRTRSVPPRDEHFPLQRAPDELLNFSVLPSDHANYAATWFLLSAFTAILGVRAMRQSTRRTKRM